MKGRVIVLGQYEGRETAALIVDGQLEDLLIDTSDDATPSPGTIFRAIVDRQMKGQGGVFLRLPTGRAFLRETGGLSPGQRVLVQVTGYAEPGKAVPVTLRLLFKSQLCIVTPNAPGINISRRIRDDDTRQQLEALATAAMAEAPAGTGLILRSAAETATAEAVTEDITVMRNLAAEVAADLAGDAELLLAGPTPHETAWRDWSDPTPDEVADGPNAVDDHGVSELVEACLTPQVSLAGAGGAMFVEPTRAVVAVDINTGSDTSPAASLKTNIAAARDLPRQLRLRGLGGMITVDFAPMPKRDRATLEQQIRAAFRRDSTETSLAGWTPLGNYELQRKRDRMPLAAALKGKI